MAPPEVWGPAVWTLLHTLSEKINENAYPRLYPQLFIIIQKICKYLPCPECSRDASIFLAKINMGKLKNKNDFKNLFYIFHNVVNVKKRKPLFNYGYINLYKRHNINNIINKFLNAYNTKGNMKLLSESFQRQFVLNDFKKWISTNLGAFLPTRVPTTVNISKSEEPNNNDVITDSSNNLIISENNNIIEVDELNLDNTSIPDLQTTIIEEDKLIETTIIEEEKVEENKIINTDTIIFDNKEEEEVEVEEEEVEEEVEEVEESNNENYISEISENFEFDSEEDSENEDDSSKINLGSSIWLTNTNNEILEEE